LCEESFLGEAGGNGEVALVDDGSKPKLLDVFWRRIE
jgi:hypothetical protein